MSTYVFKAIDLVGVQSKGEVEAESKQAVNDQLKARGLIVLDIAEKRGSKEIKLPWGNRVKAGDLTIMTRQLSTMVSSRHDDPHARSTCSRRRPRATR